MSLHDSNSVTPYMLPLLLTHQSSKLFMRGKLRAKHCVCPAHVKAGFKGVNRHRIDNIYRNAGGTFLFLQTETLYNPCVYLYTSIMSPLSSDETQVRGEQVSLVGWHNRHSSSQGPSSLLFFVHPPTILFIHWVCYLF